MKINRLSLLLSLTVILAWTIAKGSHAQSRDAQDIPPSARDARPAALAPIDFPPLEGPVDPALYVLGPGDQLELRLFGRVTARVPLVVNAEGSIAIPNLGQVLLGGLTITEARARLATELDRQYRGVRADMTLIKPRRILVHVVGEVRKPGMVELQGPARVSEAVKVAGGFTEVASRRNLTLRRARGGMQSPDLERYVRLGLLSENPYLDNGDVVRVPALELMVELHGQVSRPGPLEFRPGDRLSEIIALGGGMRASADSDSVEVWRFNSPTTAAPMILPLRVALESPGSPSDPPLQADDRIFVRNIVDWRQRGTVDIRGEAIHPGIYAIPPEGQLASALIARFGGFTARADVGGATVIRPSLVPMRDTSYVKTLRDGRELSAEDMEFLRTRALAHGNLSARLRSLAAGHDRGADFLVQDGDFVVIPIRTGSVAIYGAVRQPGAVPFRPGAGLGSYIDAVGGYGSRADRGKVRVTQAATGLPVRAADLRSIEDGDIVWVPERERVSFFKSMTNVVGFLAQVATIYLVIDQATK